MPKINPTPQSDLLYCLLFTIGFVFSSIFFEDILIRLFFSIPVIFFFPGYSLINLRYPRANSSLSFSMLLESNNPDRDPSMNERIILSILISLVFSCTLLFIAYTLQASPSNNEDTILITLGNSVLALLSFSRRIVIPEEERFRLLYEIPFSAIPRKEIFQASSITFLLLATLLFAPKETFQDQEDFSELYLLGPGLTAEDYPRQLNISQGGSVVWVATNQGEESREYQITITHSLFQNKSDSSPISYEVIFTQNFLLSQGDELLSTHSFFFQELGFWKVNFSLSSADTGQPNRELNTYLWVLVQ
tara:strand:- start:1034 stop:1948 length:915 start_codon:yes stop_codon:yes gene_type:complete